MSIRENRYKVIDRVIPRHVLVSVFDKTGLDGLVNGLIEVNPKVIFYSTGGTGKKIAEILGDKAAANYMPVEVFTGAPEMEGGLVKTLHPKIHAGLLAERGNPAHMDYLERTLAGMGGEKGVYFDVLVANLYPFTDVVTKAETTAETARVNIDIGGPAMTMAGAKNWHSVAVLSSPGQYADFLMDISANGGAVTARKRFTLAKSAFAAVGRYRMAIADYFGKIDFDRDIAQGLNL